MIRAGDVNEKQETKKVTVVEVSDAVVHPWAMVVWGSLSNCCVDEGERQTHAKDASGEGIENLTQATVCLQPHLRHCLQWCDRGGLNASHILQYLGVLVSFFTSKPSSEFKSGSYADQHRVRRAKHIKNTHPSFRDPPGVRHHCQIVTPIKHSNQDATF